MKKYVVVPSNEISVAMVNVSKNDSINTLRKNLLEDVVFKFNANDQVARQVFINYEWFSLEEILEIMKEDIWDLNDI